jgi:hypothetical protein
MRRGLGRGGGLSQPPCSSSRTMMSIERCHGPIHLPRLWNVNITPQRASRRWVWVRVRNLSSRVRTHPLHVLSERVQRRYFVQSALGRLPGFAGVGERQQTCAAEQSDDNSCRRASIWYGSSVLGAGALLGLHGCRMGFKEIPMIGPHVNNKSTSRRGTWETGCSLVQHLSALCRAAGEGVLRPRQDPEYARKSCRGIRGRDGTKLEIARRSSLC